MTTAAEIREIFEERAGIHEFCGGLHRDAAERAAGQEVYRCQCGHAFSLRLGKYGCPNCCGEGR